jgi:hypothetical protein
MKAIRFTAKRGAFLSLGLLALAAGCSSVYEESFTYKLWNNESFRRFNEPASDPHLLLFADTKRGDVLVQYDEVRDKDGRTRRRAFFANANRRRIEAGLKPRFVSANAAAGLEPIPILRAGSGQSVPTAGLCVVMEANGRAFTLRSDGQAAATVTLPTYGTTGGFKKAFLTPLAVTGDTLVVGVTAGVIVACAWAQSGFTVSTCR